MEKTTRSALRAAVEQALDVETVVVLDALNYVKGVRYELYCKARAESTTYCVVRDERVGRSRILWFVLTQKLVLQLQIYVDTPLSVALERNAASDTPYDPDMCVHACN